MVNIEKAKALLGTLNSALNHYSTQCLDPKLGDRSSYVGLSDVGKGMECMRAAVASKFCLPTKRMGTDSLNLMSQLRRQITLQRGHWQEDGLEAALTAYGLRSIPQLSIALSYKNVPIQAHLDFTLVWGGAKPAVRVLELKSNENIPKTLYASYETQLHGQLALLREAWNKPCFLHDEPARYRHLSRTCRQAFGAPCPIIPKMWTSKDGW